MSVGELFISDTDDITFDPDIFPRDAVDKALVQEYADALKSGAEFPPIEVLPDKRIVGGVHRWHAHAEVGVQIRAVIVEPPDGVPLVVFAAGLNAKNGKRQSPDELKRLVLDQVRADPDVSLAMLADQLGMATSTLHRWAAPITQAHDRMQKLKAAVLLDAGWTQAQVGVEVGKSRPTIAGWVSELPKWETLTPEQVQAAVADMTPTARAAADPIVTEWADAEKLRERDKRDAERIRMAIRGWDQFRTFRDHDRRDQVIDLLTDAERSTLADMEAAFT